MDPERQRIEEDLRGLVAGDVYCDEVSVEMYDSDASIFEIKPQGIVRPKTTDDVVATARYASENSLPLHARGGGSGLAGESLGRGLILDFSRYMRRVLKVDADSVRVQAGVIHGELNRLLAPHGRLFGPDPATTNVSTMGGVVAIDASGSHFLRYGSTRQHVRSLRIVMADGEVLDVSQHTIPPRKPLTPQPNETIAGGLNHLVWSVADLLRRNQKLIEGSTILSEVNRSGYALGDALADVLAGKQLDLAKLLVGTEGTLALITEATVDTQQLPEHTGCALLLFDSLDKAARAAQQVLSLGPSVCDLMDRRHLSLAREMDLRYEQLVPNAAEALLLIEHEGESLEEVETKLRETVKLVTVTNRLAAGAHIAADQADRELYWQLAQRLVPTLYRLQGVRRAVPFIEDIAVPVKALPVFLRHLQDALKHNQVTASVFAHAGHGQLHIRPFLDLANPKEIERMESLAEDLYEKVWLLGGTISGQHGDGISRTPFLSRQYGALSAVFRELKRLFDPQNVLNPGKIVPEAGSKMTQHLRRVSLKTHPLELPVLQDTEANPKAAESKTTESKTTESKKVTGEVELQLSWSADQAVHAARTCNGCAACRTNAPDSRMCPINRFAPREEASPRAKANLMRALLTGQLPSDSARQEAFKKVSDLCVHCHMCRVECPANVDIPKLMVEAKAEYVTSNGLSFHEWSMARIDLLIRLAGQMPRWSNWLLQNRQSRWIIEKIFGISQSRLLPRLANRPFLKSVAKRGLDQSAGDDPHRVALFVDTFANSFDTELAETFVHLLEHNGVKVYVPSSQQPSGMPLIAQGSLDLARRVAQRNIELLAEAVRRGYTIVSTEPSAVLALTREYPALFGEDEDVDLVAENTQDACEYLWKLHQRGGLQLDFQPQEYDIAYHVPCHLKALEIGTPSENLLRLVPGLKVHRVEKGCSGMAGTWGLRRRNYRNSLRIGLPLIAEIRNGPYLAAMTECSTCAMQINQGNTKPTVHPIKVLAAAYGLLPPVVAPQGRESVGQEVPK